MTTNKQPPVEQYESMGFDINLILQAWQECKGNESQMLDTLFKLSEQNQKMIEESNRYVPPQQTGGISNEDVDINKAIELSLKETKNMPSTYEPLNPEQRLRKSGTPIGLKNIGNTCYVNSLFQAYFMSYKLVASVLHFNPEIVPEESKKDSTSNKEEKDLVKKRTEASLKQMKNLRKLFAMMTRSHKKYTDPTDVLQSVVDDFGQQLPIGDQKDVTEYHTNFVSRIEEAFEYQQAYLKAKEKQNNPNAIQIEESVGEQSESVQAAHHEKENSLITQHFYGVMRQYRSFMRHDFVTEESDSVFGPLLLDVANKDLYSGLEKYCNFTIDDYRLSTGELTKVEGNSWIIRPPEFLFVQLNRVSFDKESGLPLKINDKFTFEKEIYLDRFMLDYKDKATVINRNISQLRTELEEKENNLQKIINYLNTQLDIIRVLEITGGFLQRQIDPSAQQSGVFDSDPTSIGKLVSEQDILTTLKTLRSYKENLEHQRDQLKETIVRTREEISHLCAELNHNKYHLVAILIHDGVAGSGHYYSFNRNLDTQTWKRFNDIYVSDENEENVIKEAIGGNANVSAYCLVYLSDKLIQEEHIFKSQTMEILDERIIEIERKHYVDILPPDLVAEVEADNILFHEEIEEYKFNSYLKSIIDTYKTRYDRITKAIDNQDPKGVPTYLNSFGCYLKNVRNLDDVLKWYIVDTVLQDSPKKAKLHELKNSPRLIKLLEDRLSSLAKPHGFKHLVLTNNEEGVLKSNLKDYTQEHLIVIYTQTYVTSIFEERWKDSCYSAWMAFEVEKDPKSYFKKLINNVTRINCLKMVLLFEKSILSHEFNQAMEIFSYLKPLAKGLLRADEPSSIQIKLVLNDTLHQSQGKLNEEEYTKLKDEIYKYGTGLHRLNELESVATEYQSETVKEYLQRLSNEDLYAWKEIDENSASNQIEKLMDDVKQKLKVFVEFYNKVQNTKITINLEERKTLDFTLV